MKSMIKKLLCGFLFVFLGLSSVIGQEILYVDINAIGNNSGTSWENAYTDLSVAIDAAQSGNEVWVAAGIYYPTMQPNYPVGSADKRFNHFTLKNRVTLYGGFAGDETGVNQRDLTAYKTVISGDIDQNDNVGENGYVTVYTDVLGENSLKLFYFPENTTVDTTAVLDGFVLAGAVADNDVFPYMGGAAMLCQGASPKVVNCEFYGNYAKNSGGAIWIKNSSMIIDNCIFSGNKAEVGSGAISFNETSAKLTNCTFTNNTGLYCSTVGIAGGEELSVIENCSFENNHALDNGGAIVIAKAKALIKNTTVQNNISDNWGGGIVFWDRCDVDLVSCTINSNSAQSFGGGIAIDHECDVRIVNSKIQGNSSVTGAGGALSIRDSSNVYIYNTLITGNKSSYINGGDAFYITDVSKVDIINSTIAENNSDNNAFYLSVAGTRVNIYNSILWEHGGEFYNNTGEALTDVITIANSRTNTLSDQPTCFNDNPLFLFACNYNYAHTDGDWGLWGNSPANNKGINTRLPKDKWDLDNDGDVNEVLPIDIDGKERVFAGIADLGCYEQQFANSAGNALSVWENQYLTINNNLKLNSTDFTIEMWVFPREGVGMDESYHNLCGTPAVVSYNRAPSLYIFQNDRIHYGYGDGTNWNSGDTEKALKVGQWNHIAMTFNDATNTLTLYANGKILETFSSAGEVAATPLDRINGTEKFKGFIDEFRIWKKELTPEELKTNMNKSLSGNEESLELYYSFDQVTGGEIEDQAGSYNGTLTWAGLLNSDAIFTPVLKPISNVGLDNFTINWNAVANASEYYIDVATDKEFSSLVKFGEPTNGATSYTVTGLSKGTVYYYKVTCETNADEWGRQYSHTATKMVAPGNALSFNGAQNQVNLSRLMYENWGELTIEAWVKAEVSQGTGTWGRIIGNYDNANFAGFGLSLHADNRTPYFEIRNQSGIQYKVEGNNAINTNIWHHLAVVFDGSSLKMYVDGILHNTTATSAGALIKESMLDVAIGNAFDGGNWQYYNGDIDEVRIWKTARTVAEITQYKNKYLNGEEEGLYAYFTCDQLTGTKIIDLTNNLSGDLINEPEWVASGINMDEFVVKEDLVTETGFTLNWNARTGPYTIDVASDVKFTNPVLDGFSVSGTTHNVTGLEPGVKYYYRVVSNGTDTTNVNFATTLMVMPGNALWLDGTDDYVEANQIAEQGNKAKATMECWAYVDPTETHGRFLAINTSTGGNKYLLSYQANEGYCLYLENGATKTTIASYDFRRGQWVHLAVTMDDNDLTSFYLNGKLVGTGTNGSAPLFSGNLISFGQEFDGIRKGDFLKGAIDEVRFWETIRTENEILTNMHKKLVSNELGLLAYYDFDQTEGQFVYEKKNGQDATIIGNPNWVKSDAIITPCWVVVDAVGYDYFDFGWYFVDGATQYKVQLATDISFTNIVEEVTLVGTHQQFSDLNENTEYYFRISSYISRWSDWSAVEEISTLLIPPGNALAFDGVDGMVDVGLVMENDWSEITLESWIKIPDEQNPIKWGRILSNYGGSKGGFGICLTKDFANNKVNHLRFEIESTSEGQKAIDSKFPVDDNVWHHVAAVYNKDKMSIYIDGKLDAEVDVTNNLLIKKALEKCGFGNQFDGGNWQPMKGVLDEIRIWNVARTPDDLKEFAHKPLVGNEDGLVAYYNVDKAEGITFKDEAGNFDGTMSGGVTWAESKALITPFTLTATNIANNSFTANWEAIPNATNYYLRVASDKLLTQPVEDLDSIDVGNVTTFDVAGLSENTKYYYGVMSYTDRTSAWSPGSEVVKTPGATTGELALSLDGTTNYIDLSSQITKVAGKNTGAVTGWFKTNQKGNIYSLTGGAADYSYIKVGDINGTYSDESFSYWIRKDDNLDLWMVIRKGNDFYTDGNWHQFAVITGDGNNRILIDGREQKVDFYSGNAQTQVFSDITSPTVLKLGDQLVGAIDEIAIYKNPITNEEVIERAHKKLTGDEIGLVSYYTFDNSNAADSSGMGRDGTVVGAVSYERANVLTTPFLNEPIPGVTLADLSWEAIASATEYIVDVATDVKMQNKIVNNVSTTETTHHITNLNKNKKYFYRIKANVEGQWSEYSAISEFFTLPGKTLILDGDGDYITANSITNYASDEATFECWVKADDDCGHGAIWANNHGSTNVNQYVLAYHNVNKELWIFTMEANGTTLKEYIIPNINLNGTWHHVAVSIKKGAPSFVFIDGKNIFEFAHYLAPIVNDYRFSIGQEWDGAVASNFFKGQIDEFRIWDIALSEAQIRANMNVSEPEGASEHYIAHFTFDEIHEGTTIKDLALQNDATIVGGATIQNSEGVIVPITLEATNPTLGAFDMHINNIASAASFEIEVAYDETFVPPLAVHENIGKNLNFTVDDLCPGVKYYFRTRAIYDENTISSWSAPDTVWTVNEDAVIQLLEASEGDYSQNLKLTWECTNDYLIDEFEIKRRIEGESNFEYLASIENNAEFYQHIDTLAEPGTYYEYTVQGLSYCYDNDTKIDTSNVGFNIPSLELSKEINDDTQEAYIRLDYEFHPDFLRNVEIVRTNIENGITQTFSEVKDSLLYRDGDVELCTPYTYQLVAKTYDYGDVKSHTKAFTLEEDIFDAIDTLDASKGYFDNKITLNWKSYKQNIIDEYQISRRKYAIGSDWQVVKIIDKGTTQVWIDEDANPGEYYEYLIVGYGTCGETILRTDSVYSVGFRQPEGIISGQITYEGGNPVFDVKLTVNYEDASTVAGNCLLFDGDDSLKINTVNSFDFTNGKTVEMWIRPQNLDNAYVLYKNSGLIIDYISSGELSVLSGAAMLTYNLKNDTENVWEDENWNHIAISADSDNLNLLVNGQKVATNAATTDLVFDTTLIANNYVGYIEELRVWNTALTDSVIDRYKGLMFGRDEEGIVCNLRFDEKRGIHAFDHSRSDDEANKSHAAIYGATWSDAIPSLATLSLGAKTEPNGNYTANGIWFKGSGDSYSITPSFGVHEFDPATRSMLISENSLVYSSQNFTDISAFIVTGNVKYFGANFPVQDVMITIDAQVCINAEGIPVTTDNLGNFEIEVPIGEHYISVNKINHVFSEGYFPPKDDDGEVTYSLFNNPISGIQFVDSTFMTVAGRIVGGTIEGDKEIGFGKSNNNLGVSDFTVEAVKGYPIDGANNTLTVTTDAQTGEYEVKLFPEAYQFVIDASHNVGNSVYQFNSIDDLTVINLANPMLENTATDTATIEEIVGEETTYYDTVYEYKYHVKRNWVYRSIPSIEVLSQNNTPYFYDSTLYVQNAIKDTVEFVLVNTDGSNRLDYPVFTKGAFYTTNISVFEEYTNIDNSEIDRVPVQDGKITVINGCATYPAPVDYTIENGQVVYDFIGGFPNPTKDALNPELSYTKTFEVHSYTGEGGSMHSQWPAGNPFRAYVFGGIPTGQNFITQGPDQLDFILRDPPGSNSSASFEKGFTTSRSTSNSWENSQNTSASLAIDIGWSVTTFIGFGAGVINTSELIAETESGISTEKTYSGGNSHEETTTFTKSYSTSDDPAYVGAMGDLFFGHSTNITYGVSNCINIIPVGTGEEDLGTDVDGFTIGLDKGLNLGLTFGTSFIYTQNHIENYLIPDLEMFYEKLLNEGDADSANYYMQQADLWRKTLAQNEYQKYWAIKLKELYSENENLSFDAGAIYEQSMETEVTDSRSSSFEFSVDKSISEELGFEAFGMGTTMTLGTEVSKSSSNETEESTTTSSSVGFTLNDGDQGDYFSVDVLKDPFGNGPVFSTLGGQSACPYEDGTTVNYADYVGHLTPSDFNNEFQLNYPTMKIEVPVISAENAIVAGVPDNEPAVFVLKLSNQSEVNADNWFTLKLDAASNPFGAKLKMDGAAIINGVSIMIPGGTTLTKTLELEKGQASVNDYENINLILHSQCQFDPTDDVADICDTVTITANFVPTCTNVELLNPSDNWLMNVEANDLMPVKIGGYNVNHGTFEKAAFQYKAESASSWNTVAMFFNDTTEYGVYAGEKYKIDGAEALFYDWDMSILQDKSYQIRAVTACADGSVTESPAHTGILDGVRPQVFGTPSPADGILEPNDEIMITFNETIEEGAVTYYNIDVQGVINGAEINHGTSVQLDGASDYIETPEGINMQNGSYSIEFWLKKEADAKGVVLSQGINQDELVELSFVADSIKVKSGEITIAGVNNFDDGNWHHYAIVYNSNTSDGSIYIDDQLVTEKTLSSANATGKVFIGKSAIDAPNYLAANINDIRIWRKALAFNDIIEQMNKSLAGNEFGLTANWPLDEAEGAILLEKAHSRNATLIGTWLVEPSSTAYLLNGTDQALTFETGSIPMNSEMDMTIELWFKGNIPASTATLFSNGKADIDAYDPEKTININLTTGGIIEVVSGSQTLATTNSFGDDLWHHIAYVVNRRAYASLFIDAEKVNNVNVAGFGSMESVSAYIGALGYIDNSLVHQTSQYFNGSIDEVRIWNLARSQDQIDLYKNNRLSGSEIGLMAYFPFETYEEVMGVMISTPTNDDLSIDPYSETGDNHCGTATEFGANGYSNISPNIKRKRAMSNVNFDFVINNDKIIITPTDELAMIEQCILEITVQNIQDKHANKMASPVTWTAYIKKNQVVWSEDIFNFDKEIEENLSFTTKVVNKGGTQQNFMISNLPSWLTVNPAMGSIDPDSEIEVEFNVSDGLNIGNYSEDIYLEGASGYNERLTLDLNVFKQAPDWDVDETAFSSSMNFIAQLQIKEIMSADEFDMIGVFAGDECRGVCNLEYKENYDSYFAFLVVYGNTNGENLTYRVWDASEGKIFSDVSPIYNFEPNAFYGNMASPILFTAGEKLDNAIELNKGWTWISLSLDLDNTSVSSVMSNLLLTDGDVVKHSDLFSAYDTELSNWFGSLSDFELGKSYRVNVIEGGNLQYVGTEAKASENPITLVQGWNRIGFVSSVNMTVNEALAGFEPQVNDIIKSQYQFAMYDGYEWVGSMDFMKPGKGYMYKSLNSSTITFVYPENASQSTKTAKNAKAVEAGNVEDVNTYEYSMSIVAHLNGIKLKNGATIGAYINNELRGIASVENQNDLTNYCFISIFGSAEELNQDINFALINEEENTNLQGFSQFSGNESDGDLQNPVELSINSDIEISEFTEAQVEVYPNPFNAKTSITCNLITESKLVIEIYNIVGEKLDVLVDETMKAGAHTFIWDGTFGDGSQVVSGIYFVNVQMGENVQTLRIVKE
ncbi:MAG: T9SS type A sorting domain-containing protein [Bacteroidales bacterium]|nr:T9SS type A sorting domain-containing protein [Bacteroidales bacterium]